MAAVSRVCACGSNSTRPHCELRACPWRICNTCGKTYGAKSLTIRTKDDSDDR